MGAERPKVEQWLQETRKAPHDPPRWGSFASGDGRRILQLQLGMGPGGAAHAAVLPCRDGRHELVMVQASDFHDEEDGKSYMHHVSPRRELWEVMTAVEERMMPGR